MALPSEARSTPVQAATQRSQGIAENGNGEGRQSGGGTARLPYALAVSLGAFLLFQIQPMMGRRVLPVFGGGSAVWMVCLLFFQSCLVVGYAYAFGICSRLAPRSQVRIHLLLLAAAALALFASNRAGMPIPDAGSPVVRILVLLSLSIGLPYAVLASTAPLMQEWFSRANTGTHLYRWYALSNVAALTALITYPVLVEPSLSLSTQTLLWSLGFLLYAGAVAWCALRLGTGGWPVASPAEVNTQTRGGAPPGRMLLWGTLSAAGSAMLLATTNQITQEVASVPLLWMLPLITYLVTFVICFDRESWYDRRVFGPLLAVTAIVTVIVLDRSPSPSLMVQLVVYLAALFTACMVCHGELVRRRPEPRHLTAFFMAMSIGGAVGGLFVAVLAPTIFAGFWEFQVALAACGWAGALTMLRDWPAASGMATWGRWGAYAGAGALSVALGLQVADASSGAVFQERSFYGVLRVVDGRDALGPRRSLVSGRTLHGRQYLDPGREELTTAYYGPTSGVALAINNHPRRLGPDVSGDDAFRVGVIGLGVGTLAAYGRAGDQFTFYELDPNVVDIARRYFSFLADTRAAVRVVLGDARLQLERDLRSSTPERFDVLVVDAFTGDAVPVHLLTAECMVTYLRHLKPGGLIAIHVSNRSLDLDRVVRGLGAQFTLRIARVSTPADLAAGTSGADWVILGAPAHPIFRFPAVVEATGDWPYGWVTPGFAAERLRISEDEVESRVRGGTIPVGRDRTGQRLVRIEVEKPAVTWTDDQSSIWEVFRVR